MVGLVNNECDTTDNLAKRDRDQVLATVSILRKKSA